MQHRCIIIGAGELQPDVINVHPITQKAGDYVIAVDGGLGYCRILGIEPDFIIGDFDSVGEAEQQEISRLEQEHPQRVQRLKLEKDDTDMIAALRYGIQSGFHEFYIYAGTGGRLEHTIANIQSLIFLKDHGADGYLLDADSSCFIIRDESVGFEAEQRGYLSLFSLGERAEGVTISGMKYTLDGATLTNGFPIGIDNEFIGEAAKIRVENGNLLVIVREHV